MCLQALKGAIDFPITPKIEAKKIKQNQYQHARDNAIASIGKIIKFQTPYVMGTAALSHTLISYWVGLLPFTHDEEEAQKNFEYLSDFLHTEPGMVLGQDPAGTASHLAKIFGEAF